MSRSRTGAADGDRGRDRGGGGAAQARSPASARCTGAPCRRRTAGSRCPGLDGAVEVVRDVDGMPHIRAETESDALAALGLCHAQDRLWQMELLRRDRARHAGRAGRRRGDRDRPLRPHARPGRRGRRRRRRRSPAMTGCAIEAYCRGVNAWLGADAFRLPLELRLLLHRRVAPWTAGRRAARAARCSRSAWARTGRARSSAAGSPRGSARARLEQLEPGYPGRRLHVAARRPPPRRCGWRSAAKARAGGAEGAGSNSWVLSADRTTTGRAAARERPAPAAGRALHLVRRRHRRGTASAAPG